MLNYKKPLSAQGGSLAIYKHQCRVCVLAQSLLRYKR